MREVLNIWEGKDPETIYEARQQGFKLGWQQGFELGWQQGFKLGWQQGLAYCAQQTAEEIANRLIQKGMSHQDVQEMTQLSSDVIERLKNDS